MEIPSPITYIFSEDFKLSLPQGDVMGYKHGQHVTDSSMLLLLN